MGSKSDTYVESKLSLFVTRGINCLEVYTASDVLIKIFNGRIDRSKGFIRFGEKACIEKVKISYCIYWIFIIYKYLQEEY